MRITLLTQQNCAFCDQAKQMLDRLASEYDFTVHTLDMVSPEGRSLAERGGIMFPPGIFIDEQALCYGRPSERRLRRAFDERVRSGPSA